MESQQTASKFESSYSYENVAQPILPTRKQSVLIFEDNELILAKYKRQIKKASYINTTFATSTSDLVPFLYARHFDLILLDCQSGEDPNKSLRKLSEFRSHGCTCPIAIVSEQPSIELYHRAAMLGANDFLIKGRFCNIVDEATRLLQSSKSVKMVLDSSERIMHSGFFRTLGLSESEIKVLSEYARDFPRYETLAQRMGTSQTRLRKTFSRVFKKLERIVSVNNTAKLAHVLTVCSLYNSIRFQMGAV